MSGAADSPPRGGAIAALLARWLLGGLFVYMGASKALDPVQFIKLVRQYELTRQYFLLNAVAAGLPWFEIFCGVLLLCGVAVRGTALVLAVILAAFTWTVWRRALAIGAAHPIPFCAIKFDCGCGAGEEFICRKLTENFCLIALSVWLLFARERGWRLRPRLWR